MKLLPAVVAVVAACGSADSPPDRSGRAGSAVLTPPSAPVVVPVAVAAHPRPPSGRARDPMPHVFAAADTAPGKRTRYRTAVILISPAPDAWTSESADKAPRFIPLVCALDGVLATGVKCGEAMPARATLRTAEGTVEVVRSTKPVHDDAGEHDYAAPYGPECCSYNTCIGTTIPYTRTGGPPPHDGRTRFGVWPADADVGLETAGPGSRTVAARDLAGLASSGLVSQAFARGQQLYAALGSEGIWWNRGRGWAQADVQTAGNGEVLLATSDVDHDGALEVIAYELWANDYGIDVLADAPRPIYAFSCGNI